MPKSSLAALGVIIRQYVFVRNPKSPVGYFRFKILRCKCAKVWVVFIVFNHSCYFCHHNFQWMTDCLSLGSHIVTTTKTWRRFYHVLRSELTKLCMVLRRISVQHIHLWSVGIINVDLHGIKCYFVTRYGRLDQHLSNLKRTDSKTKYRYKYFKQTWKFQQEDNDPWVKWSSPWRRDGIAWCAAGERWSIHRYWYCGPIYKAFIHYFCDNDNELYSKNYCI